jgi:hypothetical protein
MSVPAVSQLDHKNEDCIVVAVLAYGKEGDELYAYDGTCKSNMPWSSFTVNVCPSLARKPKIFIVQVSVQSVRFFLGKCMMRLIPKKIASSFHKNYTT